MPLLAIQKYICRGCSICRLRSCSVDSSSNHGTYIHCRSLTNRGTANNKFFQGDSLWGSLHVLLFNTVSRLIQTPEKKELQIEAIKHRAYFYLQVIFLLFLAHGRAVFSDPGIVPLPKHRSKTRQANRLITNLFVQDKITKERDNLFVQDRLL